MSNGPIAKVRVRSDGREWTAELRAAAPDLGKPARVDVWYGVEWCGQWEWKPETAPLLSYVGEAIGTKPRSAPRVQRTTLDAIGDALRVNKAVSGPSNPNERQGTP